ncbi:MAG: sulfotransferase family protein [Actinomycetes bacterium]
MSLTIVGAGLGRTGTSSLQEALGIVLDGRVFHMGEVFANLDSVSTWQGALDGTPTDWSKLLDGYCATLDWPAVTCWREIAAANPAALVLLSTRSSADEWWKSVSKTLFAVMDRDFPPDLLPMRALNEAMFERLTPNWRDRDAAMAAYDAHNASVRAEVPSDRLIDWRPRDGWEPICSALGIPVPALPFPHANTSDDFQKSADERLNR